MPLLKGREMIPLFALFLFCDATAPCAPPFSAAPSSSPSARPQRMAQNFKDSAITILYDNNRFDPRLKTEWGFSCLVRGLGKTILFDTGGDGAALLFNMTQLGIEPAEVDAVVLSHIHGDHTGGLARFLRKKSDVLVHLPASFPESFKKAVRSFGAQVEEVSEAQKLFPGAYTTGELGDGIKEQALALRTKEGLVVLTGCAHPGVVSMVRKAVEITREDRVYLVIGGFHLGGEPASRIESIAKEFRLFSVQKVAPCHCSGEGARKVFRQRFGADCIESGVGVITPLPKFE